MCSLHGLMAFACPLWLFVYSYTCTLAMSRKESLDQTARLGIIDSERCGPYKKGKPYRGTTLAGKTPPGTTLTRTFGLLVAGHFDAYQMRQVQPFTIVRRPRAVLLSTRWVSVALMSPSVDKVNNTDETHRLWVS